MNYKETLDYLYASQPAFHLVGGAAYKPGLDNTRRLMEHLGNPHEQWPAVHVAGTNGKGSTSHLIAAVLQAAGLRVGLYTSPHLVDYRERIRVNGEMVPEDYVVQFVEQNKAFLEEVRPSFFETTMAMAFAYFAEQKVDIAVVEVGLGGRLDSTNILTPVLSVVTNIGFDHTEFLGDTLEKIAAEKAGIIKPGVPCVIGETLEIFGREVIDWHNTEYTKKPIPFVKVIKEQGEELETVPVFLQRAKECGILGEGLETTDCRIWFADQCGFLKRVREREAPECQLKGAYQAQNQQTAYVALRVLHNHWERGACITSEAIRRGFAEVCTLTGLRGRWEVLQEQPLIICDTGHNAHGLQYVAGHLKGLQCSRECALHVIFGMVSDKDIDAALQLMPSGTRWGGSEKLPNGETLYWDGFLRATYYFVAPNTPRAVAAEEMQQRWQALHGTESHAYPTLSEAIAAARKKAREKDIIFIGGSNYLVGEALALLDKTKQTTR